MSQHLVENPKQCNTFQPLIVRLYLLKQTIEGKPYNALMMGAT